ncbi:MAG TPA: response regulator [Ktedonobacteraceae bacterium]|jgi:CheY-like chemotaxis protein|nr:response regulator [Ktedonobacteraceae bacterium]
MEEIQRTEATNPTAVKTILIVEDDIDIGFALAQVLKEETSSYRVIFATDGFQALKMVRTIVPQIIILDYLLPNMDGLEVVEKLRVTKGMEQTPIIFMSANMPRQARERNDLVVLEKPFELDALLHLVKQFLDDSR